MDATSRDTSQVLMAGVGICGIAAALALERRGHSVKVLEQSAQRGEALRVHDYDLDRALDL